MLDRIAAEETSMVTKDFIDIEARIIKDTKKCCFFKNIIGAWFEQCYFTIFETL